jgi:hypothetical protein
MNALHIMQPAGATSRRGFLKSCAACAACSICPSLASSQTGSPAGWPSDKARVQVVYSTAPPNREGWPYVNYDYESRKKAISAKLEKALPGIEFSYATVNNAKEGAELLDLAGVDGYVVFMLGIPSGRIAQRLLDAGKRVVLVDDLYGGTGEFLGTYARAKAEKKNVAGVSSSRFDDVVQAVRCFEALRKLRASTILDICERAARPDIKGIQEAFGTAVRTTTSKEINEAYRAASKAEAQQFANKWIKNARKIVEPAKEEILRSGLMYVAMRELMKEHKAQALDIDCLQLFYGKKLPAYPCLGLCEFNDSGLVGACEADLASTITMLAMTYLVGRPGFISDPVIDTSKNQIIYAHCVAPTKPYGPNGKSIPYHLRDHSEDRKGAVVQSFFTLGEMTTTLKFAAGRKEIIFHQAKAVANVEEDRACRTKLAAEVKDPFKLLAEWHKWGWHRVTYAGDFRQAVEAFAGLAGFSLIVEG